MASDSELPELTESDSQQSMKKVEQSVFDVGFYIMQASVVFKVCTCNVSNVTVHVRRSLIVD